MSLRIIGAGFGRTGTNSLRLALNMLGAGPCYHMHEVINNPGHRQLWYEIANGSQPDWDQVFKHYRSAVDWPTTHYWHQLSDYYPDAKIILTIRDPEDWFKSFYNTILRTIHLPELDELTTEERLHRKTIFKIIAEQTFDGRPGEKQYAIKRFNDRIKNVSNKIEPPRLLIYDVRHGWAPLCNFLQLPIPNESFPHTNTTAEFISQAPERYKKYMRSENERD